LTTDDFGKENELKDQLMHVLLESDIDNSYTLIGILETMKQQILDAMKCENCSGCDETDNIN
jgi:hypothetical protein